MHPFANLYFTLTKHKWNPAAQTCFDKYSLPCEMMSWRAALQEQCCIGTVELVGTGWGTFTLLSWTISLGRVLYCLGIQKLGLRQECVACFVERTVDILLPGFDVRGRNVIFRVCEELNASCCHQYYRKVSLPKGSTMTALWGASKQLCGLSSQSEQILTRLGAGEPGWGLDIPWESLVSAAEIRGYIYGVHSFSTAGISAN